MNKNHVKKIKVAIVYHYIAHYRKAIFNEMCSDSNKVEYFIVADEEESNDPSIKILTSSELSSGIAISKKWKKIKNIWITKHILWQKGVIGLAWSKDYDVQIMLGNMYFISSWLAIVVAKIRGKQVYLWTHGFRNEESGVKGNIRCFFYGLADGLFLYGNRAKDILIKKGFLPNKLHVIYNSLDFDAQIVELGQIGTKDIDALRKYLDIGDQVKVIVAIGRITKEKKLDMLVSAIFELNKNKNEKYKLIIVGDGPEKRTMEEKVYELSVTDDVIFYGDCYEENKLALLLSMANVSAVPGDIGLSAIHSLTYGTPVVTHNNFTTHKPEFEAIQDGINGSFYISGNIGDLVEKIRFWCNRMDDRVTLDCQTEILKHYNPKYQKSIFNQIIEKNYQKLLSE